MKIRIYAILPDTAPDTMEPIGEEIECEYSIRDAVDAVTTLYPNWLELNIERIVEDT